MLKLRSCETFSLFLLFLVGDVHRQPKTSFESKQLMIIVLQWYFANALWLVSASAKFCLHEPTNVCFSYTPPTRMSASVRHFQHSPADICFSWTLSARTNACLLQLDTFNTYQLMSASAKHCQHAPTNVWLSYTPTAGIIFVSSTLSASTSWCLLQLNHVSTHQLMPAFRGCLVYFLSILPTGCLVPEWGRGYSRIWQSIVPPTRQTMYPSGLVR